MTTYPKAARRAVGYPRRFGRPNPEHGPDLAEEVAAAMVGRLLLEQPDLAAAARADGSVTILAIHAREWVMPVRRAWIRALFEDDDGLDIVSNWPLVADVDDEDGNKAGEPRWHGFARDDPARKADRTTAQHNLITAFQSGKPVFGWSHDPETLLPAELLRMADRVVVLSPPSPETIAEAAQVLADAPCTEVVPDAIAHAVLPHHLRMAWRPGASADQLLQRLARIIGGKASQPEPDDRLETLLGMNEARDWGLAVARDLPDYESGRIRWADMDKAVLLAGPPGTGKTTFARRLSTTCGIPLVIASPQEWQGDRDGHLGHALGAMQRTFREARTRAPCILFLDEIDSMGDRARFDDRNRDYSTAYLNGLLEQLDGVNGREGVIVVAACNHPDRLDPALTRSGRLDRVLRVPLPDDTALAGMVRQRLGDDLPDVDLSRVVRFAVGGTGADAERWVRSARRRARHARRPMTLDDLMAEIRPKDDGTSPELRRRAAIHEAGHALVGTLDSPGSVIRVSLATGPEAGGFIESRHEALFTREAVERHLKRLLAGRAAEEIVLGEVSSGAGGSEHSDLAKASMLAVTAITCWGLASSPEGSP